MPTPDPRLVEAIRRVPRPFQVPLLTTALIESGGRLDAVGDAGRSHGPYQEYDLGRGAGIPIAQRRDPFASTQRALREFQVFYGRGARGADLAYRAQRPADRASYVRKYQQYAPIAMRILNQHGGAAGSPAPRRAPGLTNPSTPSGPAPAPDPRPFQLAAIQAIQETGTREGVSPTTLLGLASARRDLSAQRAAARGAPAPAGRQAALDGLTQAGRPADPSAAQVINAARAQLGTPYSWGGGTPAGPTRGTQQGANTVGFDCSSLVQYAWAKAGVKLPRTTDEQIKTGQAVNAKNRSAWRPGDLLFPSTGHVQMYIGDGKVIEAPRTGGRVQIVPARSSYIAVRRPG